MSDQTFDKLIVNDRVGIGTERPEPESQLHISPTGKDGKIYLESGGNLLQVIVNSTIATIGTSGNFPLQLQANLNQSKFSGIYISNSGNVGIGTTTPSFNLDVQGIINATQFNKNGQRWKITDDDIDDNTISGIKIKPQSISLDKLERPISGSQWKSGSSGSSGSIYYSDGNVGIGNPSPSFNLDVKGIINATQFNKNGSPWIILRNEIADKAINADKIDDLGVSNIKIANKTITGDKIADKTITKEKLASDISLGGGSSQWQGADGGPISYTKGNVGIGTANPQAKLQVGDGAIMPSVGNSPDRGIMFPPNPGDGGGDAAWIRYYRRGQTGEATTLEIGISDNTDDHIALMSSGNVGIGTTDPQGKLDVRGDIRAGNSDIYFTKTDHKYTAIGDTKGYAAIENGANFDALMILGRAGTPKGRNVKLWDYLQVNGSMDVTGKLGIGTQNPEALLHVYSPDQTFGGNIKLFPTSGKGLDFAYDGGQDGLFGFTHYGKEDGETRFQWQASNGQFKGLMTITNKSEVYADKFLQWSSRELKENITNFSTQEAIEALADLNPVKFNYREDKHKEPTVGFIAEDVPELVATADRKGICPLEIVAVLTKVIQQQQQELSCLKERLNALEASV
jgi:hypothetical protein